MSEDGFRGELSFVDLALVLVKRRYVLLGALILFSGMSVFHIASKEPVYEWESLYQLPVADTGNGQLFNVERVANDVIFSRWPLVVNEYSEEHAQGVPFGLSVIPDTGLSSISLKSKSRISYEDSVGKVHKEMLDKLSSDLNDRFESYKARQQSQREQLEATVNDLSAREASGNQLGQAYENLFLLEERLATMEEGSVVAIARPSEKPVSVPNGMLLLALLSLSAFGSVVLAFLVEFVSVVKKAMKSFESADDR